MKLSARTVSVPSLIVLGLAVFTGCGSALSTEPASDVASIPSASVDTTATESTAPRPEPSVPAGYKMATAEANEVAFAVPEEWVELDSEIFADADAGAVKGYIDAVAPESDLNAEALVEIWPSAADVLTIDPVRGADGVSNTLSLEPEPYFGEEILSEAALSDAISDPETTIEGYRLVDTPLGEGSVLSYTRVISLPGRTVNLIGAIIVVPRAENGFALMTLTTGSDEERQQLIDAITRSVTTT